MGIEIPQTKNEVIPVGEYPATIDNIEDADGQFGPQLKFTFSIASGPYADKVLSAWCSKSFNVKSKLFAWTKAVFGGVDIPEDYNFDSDQLVGQKVMLTVIKKQSPDGAEYNKVDSVSPMPKAKAAVKVAPKPPFARGEDVPF